MIDVNYNCKVCGMAMQAIVNFQNENGGELPVVLEIGSAEGYGVMRYAGFCKRVIAIDTMVSGRPDVHSLEKETMNVDEGKLKLFNDVTRSFANVDLVIGSSSWEETLEEAKRLSGGSIDILVIDGAHHPESVVQQDFDMYSPLVRKGGYVIFDDFYEKDIRNVYERVQKSGDYEVVEEFKQNPSPILQWVALLRKTK